MREEFDHAVMDSEDADSIDLRETVNTGIVKLTTLSILIHNLHRDAREIDPAVRAAVPPRYYEMATVMAEEKINAGTEFADPENGLRLANPTPANCWPLCLPEALFQMFKLDEMGRPHGEEESVLGDDDSEYFEAIRRDVIDIGLNALGDYVDAATAHLNRALVVSSETPAAAYIAALYSIDNDRFTLTDPIGEWIVPYVELAARAWQMEMAPLASAHILN